MQPYFFPHLGYFQLMDAVDAMLLYPHVAFIKGGWVNRNRILHRALGPVYVTVPVKNASSHRLIRDVEIDGSTMWKRRFLDLLHHEYRRAPHFEPVSAFIDQALQPHFESLSQLNLDTVRAVADLLGMGAKVSGAGDEFHAIEEIVTGFTENRKSRRVIELCRFAGASTFVNPSGGRALYDPAYFREHGVELLFLDSRTPPYPQRSEGFAANLSIIDVLFNCGVEGTRALLASYDLTERAVTRA